ncbi:hypothetical protein A1F94_008466 [Pyrenophora tritici-repentis]|nr:hypothetical protein A1F94_008466 [Pyrenophora tritici-repentis]
MTFTVVVGARVPGRLMKTEFAIGLSGLPQEARSSRSWVGRADPQPQDISSARYLPRRKDLRQNCTRPVIPARTTIASLPREDIGRAHRFFHRRAAHGNTHVVTVAVEVLATVDTNGRGGFMKTAPHERALLTHRDAGTPERTFGVADGSHRFNDPADSGSVYQGPRLTHKPPQ